jgi:sporulation protein YlmC with PRC-barrel domain
MRLADLIGSHVFDADDRDMGRVGDVWLIQDGPPIGVFGAALTVEAVVIGRFGLASRAGYERDGVRGPAPIAWYFRRQTAHRQVVGWSDVAAIEEGRIRLRLRENDLGRPSMGDVPATGRRLSAGLELLDRQLIDLDGMMAGKVDDLAIEFKDDGAPPVVTEILAGPGALARRIGGRLGAWLASVDARLRGGSRDPAAISFGVVARIDDHVTLTVSREEVATFLFEEWVRDHMIEKLPGS